MVKNLEEGVADSKKSYSDALRNLEEISESIHQKRLEMRNEAELGVRGSGVGSESPSPPPMRGKDHVTIDGQSVHLISSCNNGYSPTTVTEAQFSVSTGASQEFRPPSVIYSSPEKARNESYRRAIEARSSPQEVLDNISEDMGVNLNDEYLSLPSGSSPQGHDDVFSRSGNYSNNSQYQGKPYGLIASQSGKGQKSLKLQGLILTPVGAGFDPLQTSLRIQTKQNLTNAPLRKPASYPYSHNTDQSSRVTPLYEDSSISSPTESMKQRVVTPSSEKSGRRMLRVPSQQDGDEGSISDTESITSGTMLDDDQVEFLTMDFSQQRLKNGAQESDAKEYRRLSLPDALVYARKVSESREHGITKRDSNVDLDKSNDCDQTITEQSTQDNA